MAVVVKPQAHGAPIFSDVALGRAVSLQLQRQTPCELLTSGYRKSKVV